MNITTTKTPNLGLTLIQPSIFKDFRGDYVEVFNDNELLSIFPTLTEFVQDDVILSRRNVLRGYHGDDRTWKYIMCLQGAFNIVVADINPQSSTFLRYDSLILDDRTRNCLLLPPKYVNAHLCLTDTCLFFYKQTSYYKGEKHQYSIKWTDFPVFWGIEPILSERDRNRAKSLTDYIKNNKLLSPSEVNL